MLNIREAAASDLPQILDIYNEAIRNLTSTFDLEEQTLDERMIWFKKFGGRHPIIVAELDDVVAGYSCLSSFRDKPAYVRSTEISVYIASNCRGHGIGSYLMEEILHRARELDYRTVIGGITGGNEASVKLHRKFGFEFVGCFKEVGFKFGEWQDVHFYQLLIKKEGDSHDS
ncbi:phosphinothricin acetyltransferase [Scopulibacillus darangshiensis]|uniref:Phosphinothricin acetyltransferase n=1 Tax=Scopulibacillus darangshiensis TaxID=442528 RepID=A0A4R2P4V9_9BACL|nr:GNAT family N-acetyltransferase [Scopulibacillus darangshiensis]TCP29793.1 phosphinothricin acetyltransferase [Scopulibacillus darangshiensis]